MDGSLSVPDEVASILRRGEIPADESNPLVFFEFTSGETSLFDTRKGLFLRPPSGVALPDSETLKAFGVLLEGFRRSQWHGARLSTAGVSEISSFAVCC
jgi:hypothetical protein